jgi:autotransporter-associated beta strand protein
VTIQHSGTIAGDLTVNGGTALLDQAGTITGNTLINSGFVQIGNNDASGSLPSGTITDNGGLVFNRSDSAFGLATVIAGAGAVTNNGSGTVALSVAETYTGPTVVNNGTLNLPEQQLDYQCRHRQRRRFRQRLDRFRRGQHRAGLHQCRRNFDRIRRQQHPHPRVGDAQWRRVDRGGHRIATAGNSSRKRLLGSGWRRDRGKSGVIHHVHHQR